MYIAAIEQHLMVFGNNFARNVVNFVADDSLSSHTDNHQNKLHEGQTDDIDPFSTNVPLM